MASSRSSWQKKLRLMMFLVFLLTTNTLNSCMAIRASGRILMMVKEDLEDASYNSLMAVKYFHEKEEKLIPAESLYFAKLPKDVPIPPSAPSNRHNSSPQD